MPSNCETSVRDGMKPLKWQSFAKVPSEKGHF